MSLHLEGHSRLLLADPYAAVRNSLGHAYLEQNFALRDLLGNSGSLGKRDEIPVKGVAQLALLYRHGGILQQIAFILVAPEAPKLDLQGHMGRWH